MKAFLLKHKRTIFWVVFLALALWLGPMQKDYYLDSDIDYFKTNYFLPFLIWTGVTICVLAFLIIFFKTKSLKQSGTLFLYLSFFIAFMLFIFQDLFLGGALFVNRLYKRELVQKIYLVSYFVGAENTYNSFHLFDMKTKQISIDNKLKNKLYKPSLKQNDTIVLKCDEGLLGVEFLGEAYK